jgi:ribosomal protein L11
MLYFIIAMLVTTKDEPRSAPVSVHVKQERGVHFVVQQPEDGQLLLARAAVPIVVNFGGLVPPGMRP